MNEMPSDPVERMVAITLTHHNIRYALNVVSPVSNRRTLDFFLPDYGMYIECKRFATDRLHEQIKDLTNVIVIQGIEAAAAFDRLLTQVYDNGYNAG